MEVIDVLSQSEQPSLSLKVSFATIINPPNYTEHWFLNSLNTIQQFTQNGHEYFAITNNNNLNDSRWKSDKMIIYKKDKPGQVTCVFSQKKNLEGMTYMAILPSLSEKTIRI